MGFIIAKFNEFPQGEKVNLKIITEQEQSGAPAASRDPHFKANIYAENRDQNRTFNIRDKARQRKDNMKFAACGVMRSYMHDCQQWYLQ